MAIFRIQYKLDMKGIEFQSSFFRLRKDMKNL